MAHDCEGQLCMFCVVYALEKSPTFQNNVHSCCRIALYLYREVDMSQSAVILYICSKAQFFPFMLHISVDQSHMKVTETTCRMAKDSQVPPA